VRAAADNKTCSSVVRRNVRKSESEALSHRLIGYFLVRVIPSATVQFLVD